jgi:hypothetical protein
MLSTMHLGSVLLGIVAGLVVGVLVGWLAGSRRRPRSPREAALQHNLPADDPGWNLPPTVWQTAPAVAAEAAQVSAMDMEAPVWSPHPALTALEEDRAAAEPEPDLSLFEALRAANRRLTDDTQARLSRESGDLPPEGAQPASEIGPPSPGADLLLLSRRLAEDSARRLSRDSEPAG